jgi:hypothetical protein
MKTYGEVDASALVGGEWSASCPCHFSPGTNWTGEQVDPRADLGVMDK